MSNSSDYRQDPFAIVPIEVVKDSRLTGIQLRVLVTILSFRNRNTNLTNPSRSAIASRCGYSHNTITHATAALEKLGWISKKGKGGKGPVHYDFHVPVYVEGCPDQTPVPDPKTGGRSEQGTGGRSEHRGGVRSEHRTGVRSGHPEQTREQNNEQTKEQKGAYRFGLDLSSWPDGVDEQAAKDWLAHRKSIKCPATQTVVDRVGKELHSCVERGIDPSEALAEALAAGWRGFKADWIESRIGQSSNAGQSTDERPRRRRELA